MINPFTITPKFEPGDVVILPRAPRLFAVVRSVVLTKAWDSHVWYVIDVYDRLTNARIDTGEYAEASLSDWPEDWDVETIPEELLRTSTLLKLGLTA